MGDRVCVAFRPVEYSNKMHRVTSVTYTLAIHARPWQAVKQSNNETFKHTRDTHKSAAARRVRSAPR